MSATPFLQLYVGDYLADTLDLTTEQHGAYLLLLMTMWRHDARLPNDHAKLARIARVSARRWHLVWDAISKFFFVDGDQIGNKRLDREHQKAVSISKKRSASGEAGGRAKALKNKQQDMANATDLPKHSQKSEPDIGKEEPSGSSKRRGTRLPDEWMPDEAFARQEGLSGADCEREADKFRDHWRSQPGQRGVKLDWAATWRNWVRNATKSAPRQRPSPNWRDEPEYRNVDSAPPTPAEVQRWKAMGLS